MAEVQIKICGITTPDDARQCLALGADLLGLIFAKSPRRVSLEQACGIRLAVPEALLVGVFMDAEMKHVVQAAEAARLDLIQLHGAETPVYCEELMTRLNKPVIKAFTYSQATQPDRLAAFSYLPFLLFDLDKGTTESAEAESRLWQAAAGAGAQGVRIFLAGGLETGKVKEALATVLPYGLDVCRGVELEPGKKDLTKVKQFIEEVKQCP